MRHRWPRQWRSRLEPYCEHVAAPAPRASALSSVTIRYNLVDVDPGLPDVDAASARTPGGR